MENYLEVVLGLGGFAVLIPFLVNLGKKLGIVKDGHSNKWHIGLQVLVFVLIAVTDVFGLELDLTQIDNVAGMLTDLGTVLIGVLGMIGVGNFTYERTKGLPGIGFSFPPK